MSGRQLRYRVNNGQLLELLPGVYLPSGSPLTWEQRVCAVTTWSGPTSAAAGKCAAAIWELPGFSRDEIEVVTNKRLRCPLSEVMVRHAKLTPSDIRVRKSLRVTSLERTLFDLARSVPSKVLENAIDHALGKRQTTLARLDRYVDAHGAKGVTGVKRLKIVLRELRSVPGTDVFERILLKTLASRGVPRPVSQFPVEIEKQRFYLDFAYPDLTIGIEAHSFKHHSQRPDWERDYVRHNALVGAGWNLLYVTWRQLRDQPAKVAASIASARANAQNLLF